VVTGEGGVSVLVGQAGTGKGVVISAAREAWEADGHRVIGTAVAGATAKRLGADTGMCETMTTDALLGRVQSGRLGLDERSVVVMDEAGMADTRRLAGLTRATSESGSKLVLVGDQDQLSPIGAGGLFDSVRRRWLRARDQSRSPRQAPPTAGPDGPPRTGPGPSALRQSEVGEADLCPQQKATRDHGIPFLPGAASARAPGCRNLTACLADHGAGSQRLRWVGAGRLASHQPSVYEGQHDALLVLQGTARFLVGPPV